MINIIVSSINSINEVNKMGKEIKSLNNTIKESFEKISKQLKLLEEGLNDVVQGQHCDRIAEIDCAIKIYEQALLMNDVVAQKNYLLSALEKFNLGASKLQINLKYHISKCDRNKKFTDFLWSLLSINKIDIEFSEYITSKHHEIIDSLKHIFMSYSYIFKIFSIINEQQSALKCFEQFNDFIEYFQNKVLSRSELFPLIENNNFSIGFLQNDIKKIFDETTGVIKLIKD